MDPLKRQLENLGRTLNDHSEKTDATDRVIHEARRKVQLDLLDRRFRAKPRLAERTGFRVAIVAVAVVLLSLGSYTQWAKRSRPLTVEVETDSAKLIGRWVGSHEETKQLRFSDGSSLSLHPHTTLRVENTSPQGASVVLGRGRTLASVQHTERADWHFSAGPFSVEVTGTSFDLAWDPKLGIFELALHQGAVRLTGPTVQGTRAVEKGEFVRIALSPEQLSGQDASSSAETWEEAIPSHQGRPRPVGRRARKRPFEPEASQSTGQSSNSLAVDERRSHQGNDAGDPRGQAEPRPSWQQLLAAGKRTSALAAVQRTGTSAAIESASAKQLWSLSQAARLGGQPSLARQVLLALRNDRGAQGRTAFVLGKVAADQLRNHGEAIQWFETYLKEAPTGPLAEQALGRLVELQAGTKKGRRAAKRYLRAFPEGAHASFARSVLR